MVNFNPVERQIPNVRVPPLQLRNMADDFSIPDIGEWSHDVLEWLGLLGLESGRVQADGGVDPHLSRWNFPAGTTDHSTPIRVLRWEGMVDSRWVTQLLITFM
jgi:ribonucleases P/MRP protein subunit RPP40